MKNTVSEQMATVLNDFAVEESNDGLNLPSWLSWRVSKPSTDYKINRIGNVDIIYKVYENQIDLVSITSFSSYQEYVFTIYALYHKFSDLHSDVNLILNSSELFDIISKYFEIEYDNYERHFCYKKFNERNSVDSNLSIEMINSDIY